MRRALLIMVVLSSTIACQDEKEYSIDPLLEPYYENFIHEANLRGITILRENLVMEVRKDLLMQYNAYGVSRKYKGQCWVWIDEDYFNKRSSKIETTVFHELGHSKLNRKHNSGWSVMNSKVSQAEEGWPTCDGCKTKLIDELFNSSNQ